MESRLPVAIPKNTEKLFEAMPGKPAFSPRPRIGLALGGGGARGYAHLGVLKALLEADIPIDIIAGSSMGAVIGAAYAAGYGSKELVDMALNLTWKHWLRLADPTLPHRGIIAGNRLEEYFATLTAGKQFCQLEKTLIVVATDLNTGAEVHLSQGSVARALRASIALPGIFCPVKLGPYLLVDGSVTAPVPVAAAMAAGATMVVAVDVSSPVDRTDILIQAANWWKAMPLRQAYGLTVAPGLRRIFKPLWPNSLSIVGRSLALYNQRPDLLACLTPPVRYWVLKPPVEKVRWFAFYRAQQCIQAGEEVGREAAKEIQALLQPEAGLKKRETPS